MNVALIIGKHNSTGVPGKNYHEVLGRPLVEYSLMAAKHSQLVEKTYVSTDSDIIANCAKSYSATVIDRPESMAKSESPTEEAYAHAYEQIKADIGEPKYVFLMFANCPDIVPAYWEEAVKKLDEDPSLDAVMSLSKYNMFAPLRARVIKDDGSTEPMIDLDSLGLSGTFDRDAMGDCYFADFAVMVVRPHCLENYQEGSLPFLWLGKKQGYVIKEFGFDVDAPWQLPVIEYGLKKLGFTEDGGTPYDS